jgi:branched-chain amino acid transport system substrate-binding protein
MQTLRLTTLVIGMLATLLLAACSDGSETIKIGGGFALTGDESSLDVPAARGAQLAVKEINTAGGINGKQIELIVRDSQFKPDVTAHICTQFVAQDHVVAVSGFSDTDSVLACGPVVQQAGVPFITVGATSPKLPAQVGDKVYLACFGDNVQAAVGAEFGGSTFGKRAYLLWDKDVTYTTLLADYFKTRFIASGGTLVSEDQYDDKATDFSAQIATVKALPRQPDFYFISAMPYNVGPVVKQFRAAGFTGPIMGGDGYDTPDLVSVAGMASNNVYFTTHALMDAQSGTDGIKKVIVAYNREYGHDPENAFAALAYDTMYLIADAIKRAGSTDPHAILQTMQNTQDFPGITGTISYPNGTHVPQKSVTVIAIKDGKFTLGAELVPAQVPTP